MADYKLLTDVDRFGVVPDGHSNRFSNVLGESYYYAKKRIAELEAIVDRLPITEDGVRVLPGDIVYWRHGGWMIVDRTDSKVLRDRYSTEAAALAAKEAT